jgi:hypothetical protein
LVVVAIDGEVISKNHFNLARDGILYFSFIHLLPVYDSYAVLGE